MRELHVSPRRERDGGETGERGGLDVPPDFLAPSFFGIVLESRNVYCPWDLTDAFLRPSTRGFVTPAPILSCANTSCTCRIVGVVVDLVIPVVAATSGLLN